MTNEEKIIWNKAVKATTKELMKYDGVIIDEEDRSILKYDLEERLLKNLLIKNNKRNNKAN